MNDGEGIHSYRQLTRSGEILGGDMKMVRKALQRIVELDLDGQVRTFTEELKCPFNPIC